MTAQLQTNRQFSFDIPTLIVGMGGTGLSCARYLQKKNCPFAIADSREIPPQLQAFKQEFPAVTVYTGELNYEIFKQYQQILVSPGVSVRTALFQQLYAEGYFILGDIELFAQVVTKPVIAITGSNGKSTVTTLVEKIANNCGVKVMAGGNLGIPALDLLASNSDLYVLELSSFQLETTYSLKTVSATVLNVSEDHMDRYEDLADYRQVKETIYRQSELKVINRDEYPQSESLSFGSDKPANGHYGLIKKNGVYQLMKGEQKLLTSAEIKLKGIYNYLNVLAALALLEPMQLDVLSQLETIKDYVGLPHRCEWVAEINNVNYYNDSKGTNTGATIAAINGFEAGSNQTESKTILIAGGVGKDADFSELGQVISQRIKNTILFGIDASLIKDNALSAGAHEESFYAVDSMQAVVKKAFEISQSGDTVLFSPACASFDHYDNYIQRGNDFKEKVLALKASLSKQQNSGDVKNAS
jgi:UDP-N-acetylmuramoylalanine--D-glutamate ligase